MDIVLGISAMLGIILLLFFFFESSIGSRGNEDLKQDLLTYVQTRGWTIDPVPPSPKSYSLQVIDAARWISHVRFFAFKKTKGVRHELVYISKIFWGRPLDLIDIKHCVSFTTTQVPVLDGTIILLRKYPSPFPFLYKKIEMPEPLQNQHAAAWSKPTELLKKYLTDDFLRWFGQLDQQLFIEYQHNRLSVGWVDLGLVPKVSDEQLNVLYQQFQEIIRRFSEAPRTNA